MAGFAGFTDEEIVRLKMEGQGLNYGETERGEPIKKSSINNTGKRGKPREKLRTRQRNATVKDVKESQCSTSPTAGVATAVESQKKEQKMAKENVVEVNTEVEKPREVEVVMEPERVKELELSNIEKMQQKQKEMEMINKKKQKMLQYTLKQRYKKTKKETETLKLVQRELSHLDNLLSVDVQILRDKIDVVCREYDAAQKRYEKAETEFINAKVNLHNKTETKNQLTEHLYSIIQENEERKAKKLEELMARLEIADQDLEEAEILCLREEAAKQPKNATQSEEVPQLTPQMTDLAPDFEQGKKQTSVEDGQQMEEIVKPEDTSNNNEMQHDASEHRVAEKESTETKGGE